MTLQDLLNILIPLAVFGIVFAIWLGVLLIRGMQRTSRSEKIGERLDGLLEGEASEEKTLALWREDGVTTTTVEREREQTLGERLQQMVTDAGWSSPPGLLIGVTLAVSLFFSVVLFLLTGSILPGIGATIAICLGFWTYLKHCVSKRVAIFEQQFVDSLDLAARSLRAGHPLQGAFRLIAEEIPAPVSSVFHEICQQQELGVSMENALKNVSDKSSSQDLRLFATSVTIQMRSGGNLADMMGRLASVIRDRLRLNRRVRVLTAQTQFSKRILLVLPFIVFFVLNLINPNYMTPMYKTFAGNVLLCIGAGGLILGAWVMSKISVLKY